MAEPGRIAEIRWVQDASGLVPNPITFEVGEYEELSALLGMPDGSFDGHLDVVGAPTLSYSVALPERYIAFEASTDRIAPRDFAGRVDFAPLVMIGGDASDTSTPIDYVATGEDLRRLPSGRLRGALSFEVAIPGALLGATSEFVRGEDEPVTTWQCDPPLRTRGSDPQLDRVVDAVP